ncbi:MAG: hypothetical protein FWG14_11515 [Peptococcaceae bacterium]|nr:hypothetical protein [Peptococcaceae bacterium]
MWFFANAVYRVGGFFDNIDGNGDVSTIPDYFIHHICEEPHIYKEPIITRNFVFGFRSEGVLHAEAAHTEAAHTGVVRVEAAHTGAVHTGVVPHMIIDWQDLRHSEYSGHSEYSEYSGHSTSPELALKRVDGHTHI